MDYTKRSVQIGLPGIFIRGIGIFMVDGFSTPSSESLLLTIIGYILILAGAIMFIIGLVFYAKGKGYSGWLGVTGIIPIIGLLILWLIPNRKTSP